MQTAAWPSGTTRMLLPNKLRTAAAIARSFDAPAQRIVAARASASCQVESRSLTPGDCGAARQLSWRYRRGAERGRRRIFATPQQPIQFECQINVVQDNRHRDADESQGN